MSPSIHDLLIQLADVSARLESGRATAMDLEAAVGVALQAREALDGWRGVEARARAVIASCMEAGTMDRFTTSAGVIIERAPAAEVVSYDPRSLDVACHVNPAIADAIGPYRRQHTRAGGLRIVKGANGHGGANGTAVLP